MRLHRLYCRSVGICELRTGQCAVCPVGQQRRLKCASLRLRDRLYDLRRHLPGCVSRSKDQIALEDIFVHTLITPDEAQVTSEITFYEVAKDLNVRQYYMLKSDAVMSGVVSDVTSDNDWQFLCEQNVPTGTTAETPFRIQGTIPHPFCGIPNTLIFIC